MRGMKALAVVGSALAFSLSALTPFYASADEELRVYTSAEIGALMPSIQGDVLLNDLSYATATFTYLSSPPFGSLSSIAYYSPDAIAYVGNEVAWYNARVNNVYTIPDSNVKINLHPNLNISCDRVKIGFVSYMYPDSDATYYYNAAYSSFTGQGFEVGNHFIPTNPSSDTYANISQVIARVGYAGDRVRFTVGVDMFDVPGGSLSTGDLSIITGGSNSGDLYVGIICPTVYTSSGGGSVSANGSLSGTISENSSGGYDVDYDISIDMPDYSGLINPELDSDQSSRMGDARDLVDEYHSAEEDLLSEADDGLSSLPDLEFDETLIEDAENPFSEFFGINLIGIMVFWVGAIAFISYVLFGKWV